jgi:hypothetical protein
MARLQMHRLDLVPETHCRSHLEGEEALGDALLPHLLMPVTKEVEGEVALDAAVSVAVRHRVDM